jgi:hypothetical protein
MPMITLLEGIDFGALIVGLSSLAVAYYKNSKESKANEMINIKEYYTDFIDDLTERNKVLSDKIFKLEDRIDIMEERHNKCLRALETKFYNIKDIIKQEES